jgi:hypothetical protein
MTFGAMILNFLRHDQQLEFLYLGNSVATSSIYIY